MNPALKVRSGIAAAFAISLAAQGAHASVLWTATSVDSFRSNEQQDCQGNYHSTNGSTVTNVTDSQFGSVIRFHKVSDDRRCEGKGADGVTITRGVTYYLGWRLKMSSTVNDNSVFQWKSYGSPMNQNYPLVIKVISNQLTLQHYQSGSATNLWRQTISPNTWYSVVLRVVVSDQASGGRVQFWWNGSSTPATLLTGGTSFTGKTFDGSEINPKWGKYGACGTTIDSYVDDLRIGTTFEDVNLGGGGSTPTPTPSPTATPTPTSTTPPSPTPTPTPTTPTTGDVEVTPGAGSVSASTDDGNVPGNTVDNNLGTRWSAVGDGQWLKLDLGTTRTVTRVGIAVYNGNARQNRFDIQVSTDNVNWTNALQGGLSSGTTTQEQSHDIADQPARWVRYVGHGSTDPTKPTTNSVTEVSLFALPSTSTPTPTPTAPPSYVEITPTGGAVTASTNDGNVPGNAVDNNLATRWSANGNGQWLQLDLGSERTVGYVKVAVYNGDSRQNIFDLQVSTGDGSWTTVFSGRSNGTTTAEETFDFTDVSARLVRYVGHMNTVNTFNSVTEVSVFAVP